MQKIILTLFFCLTGILFSLTAQTTYYLNNQSSAQYLGGNCFRLTKQVANQRASVWYAPKINLSQRFDISFTMNFGNVDANGADGMAFVLQNLKRDTTAIGSTGGSFGYVGLDSSFAVEFDTYQNTGISDPAYDHIALISKGVVDHAAATNISGPVSAKSTMANIEDSVDHAIRVTWNPANDSIKVYFDCELRIKAKYNLISNIFQGNTSVRWGFTGSTGGKTNQQGFCLSQAVLSVLTNATICAHDTVSINAPVGSNYSWTPSTNISNVSIASPKLYPSSTTTYHVSYTDPCGQTQTDSVTITVNASPATPTITGSVNFDTLFVVPATYSSYQWYKNSVLLAGQTSSTLAIGSDTSHYTVVVSNSNGCTSSAVTSHAILLPVELVSFDADYNGESVDLSWVTASEINNDYFTIERTRDGTGYDVVTTVNGAGNSTWLITYSATDNDPLPGRSFYRLRQTDYDGHYACSGLVPVNVRKAGRLNIISLTINAGGDILTFNVFSPSYPIGLEIADMNGKIVQSGNMTEPFGSIGFRGIAHGIYAVRIFNSSESVFQKLIY